MLDNLDRNNVYNNQQFGAVTNSFGMNPLPTGEIPSMQADISTQKLKEGVTDSYIGNRLTSFSDIDPMLQYGVTIPTWLVINQAMDKYLKLCQGDYNKTLLYKIGNAGDKISNFFNQSPVTRAIGRGVNKGIGFFKRNVYDKSTLVRAFDKTPSVPELALVKTQAEGLKSIVAHDCSPIWEGFLKPLKCAKDFDCLGLSKAEIEDIEKRLGKASSDAQRKLILEAEEFRALNPDKSGTTVRAFQNSAPQKRAEILKELKVKAMGFSDVKEYELINKEPGKYIDRILEILQKQTKDKKLYARIGYSDSNFLTKLKGELLGRKVPFSEAYNKLVSSLGAKNSHHQTALGRNMVKISNQIMEGATSRIAGGKLAALMQAYFLAEVIIRASRQETTGDKLRSFAERLAELIGFFVFIPPSVQLMHKIGGMQYSGMTPQQVEAYRKALNEFNDKVMRGAFKNKKEYKEARNILKGKFRPKTKNPLVWLGRKTADVVTVGLEQIRPYSKHTARKVDLTITNLLSSPKQYLKNLWPRFKDVMRNPKYWAKQVAGYPVRFALPMLIFIPFFNKILVKGTHMVFGRPKQSLLDEEPKDSPEEVNDSTPVSQSKPGNVRTEINPAVYPAAAVSSTNLLDRYKDQTPPPAQISHAGDLTPRETIQKQEAEPSTEPAKRYIPSPEGVKIEENHQNLSDVDKALKRAEKAEKLAIETLSI